MVLRVKCPNGHSLKVDEKYAGRTGVCPSCKAKVRIPELKKDVSEDAILLALSTPESKPGSPAGDPGGADFDLPVHQEPTSDEARSSDSTVIAPGSSSSVLRAARRCPSCKNRVPPHYTICPHCRRYLMELPEADTRSSLTCPTCGVPSFPGSEVCTNCGTQLLLRQ